MNERTVPWEEVEARMRPGRFSQVGFLGADESLVDVLAMDTKTLAGMSLTASVLAEGLAALLEPVVASGRSSARVGHYKIVVHRYKGFQICPFASDPHRSQCQDGWGVHYASIDWRIRNVRTGQELAGPGLIVHLVGAHGFFEGLRSTYRVGPQALAQLLELGPYAASRPGAAP
jgi:hypothetical protein